MFLTENLTDFNQFDRNLGSTNRPDVCGQQDVFFFF